MDTLRYYVTQFVYDKLTDPDDDGIEEHPEHRFDLISYWKDDTNRKAAHLREHKDIIVPD
mgnify:CR=1 FL=1